MNQAVRNLEELVGNDVRVLVAHRFRDDSADQVVRGLVHEGGEARVEQRDRDARAASRLAPSEQGCLDRRRRVQAADHVEHRDADLRRLFAGVAGEAHEAGHRLHDDVVARTGRRPRRRRTL